MKLVIASNNMHKVEEIKSILAGKFEAIYSLGEMGIDIDVVEDGVTFAENAAKKAHEILAVSPGDCAVIADDSGLEVDALGGAPGVYSARFAGEGHDDKLNNKKLLTLLDGLEFEKRTGRFVCAMVLAARGREDIVSLGIADGKILTAEKGMGGFGYDPLFLYEPLSKTFAELSADEKNAISHRRKALEGILEKLANI